MQLFSLTFDLAARVISDEWTNNLLNKLSPAAERSCSILSAEGFAASNLYADGVVRMERKLPNGDTLYTFVSADGSHKKVGVWEETLERLAKEQHFECNDNRTLTWR